MKSHKFREESNMNATTLHDAITTVINPDSNNNGNTLNGEAESWKPKKITALSKRKKLSMKLLGDVSSYDEGELLSLFDEAESQGNITLMMKILNRLIECKIIYFDFMHRMMNVYYKYGIANVEHSSVNNKKEVERKETSQESDIYNQYSHIIELFQYLIEMGDTLSHRSHVCDTIAVCLYTIFNKLDVDTYGFIDGVYISKSSAKSVLLTAPLVFEKSLEFLKQALNTDNFNSNSEKMNCYRHFQECYYLYGHRLTSKADFNKAFEMYCKGVEWVKLEFHGSPNTSGRNVKDFISNHSVVSKMVQSVKSDFEQSSQYLTKFEHVIQSAEITPQCVCSTCRQ
ncbi:hypothetical protein C9374_000930 [Naegleria lovaniensis]|uniref:Uncharacterized protein n=1 Tax=Naegleria lovaniensis TaxID=51637 RepID=A0AA88GW59_NAELO|nr:uncharacterized protein C9374_000930 [Naegleria lovaniensis]KAG2388080.1 hypothetical protein C9374_000930 [Naegleria lovaniensis]